MAKMEPQTKAYCSQGFSACRSLKDIPSAVRTVRPLFCVALSIPIPRNDQESVLNLALFRKLIADVVGLLQAEVSFVADKKCYTSLDDMMRCLHRWEQNLSSPDAGFGYPTEMLFTRGNETVCVGTVEGYCMDDAPKGCDDSYVFVFYLFEDKCAEMLAIFQTICKVFAFDLQPCIQEESTLDVAVQKDKSLTVGCIVGGLVLVLIWIGIQVFKKRVEYGF